MGLFLMVIYEWSSVASTVSNSEMKNPKYSYEMYVREYKVQKMQKESQVER